MAESEIYVKRTSAGYWGIHYAGTILRLEDDRAIAVKCARVYAKFYKVKVVVHPDKPPAEGGAGST